MAWQRVVVPDRGGPGESMSIKLAAGEGDRRRENARRGAGSVVSALRAM